MDGSVAMRPSTIPHRTPTGAVEIKSINLALQGGGAHGAFTWGVLDPCSRMTASGSTASAQRVPAQ
jgi:hypothetical protein